MRYFAHFASLSATSNTLNAFLQAAAVGYGCNIESRANLAVTALKCLLMMISASPQADAQIQTRQQVCGEVLHRAKIETRGACEASCSTANKTPSLPQNAAWLIIAATRLFRHVAMQLMAEMFTKALHQLKIIMQVAIIYYNSYFLRCGN